MTLDSYKSKNSRLIFLIAFAFVFLIGVYLRIRYINRDLEYDEIWTLLNYSSHSLSKIFTDLATPNNHPINSLLIKYLVAVFGAESIVVRIPALISGIFLLIAVPALTFKISEDKFATLASALICVLNPGLVYYSQTGRGYEFQSLLILLTAFFIVSLEKKSLNPILAIIFILASSIVSILTIPTSVLFLFPIILCHIFFLFRKNDIGVSCKLFAFQFIKDNIYIIAAYSALLFFSLFWFGTNYAQFKAGQNFGTSVTSIRELLTFSYSTLLALVSLPILTFSLFCWLGKNTKSAFPAYLLILITPFVGALVTKQGPIRVYLPLVPMIAIFAAMGISGIMNYFLKKKILVWAQIIVLGCIATFLFNKVGPERFSWLSPYWPSAVKAAYTNMPENTYVSLPATSGYPVMFNAPIIFEIERERTPRGEKSILVNLIGGRPNYNNNGSYSASFNGINPFNGNTTNQVLTFKAAPMIMDLSSNMGCFAEFYELIHITDAELPPGNNNFFVSVLTNGKKKITFGENFHDMILLNFWLRKNKFSSPHMTFIANGISLSKEDLMKVEKATDGQVKFYTITPISLSTNTIHP